MKVLVLCALVATAAASRCQAPDVGGPSIAQKQHDVNYLLFKIYEENRDPHMKELENTFDPEGSSAHYDDGGTAAHKIMKEIQQNRLLEKNHFFSLFNKQHRDEALILYDILEYSSDWATFVGNAAYFRHRMNSGLFVYGLYAAVLHSHLTEHIVLPPLYEVTPHLFTNAEVIQEAYRAKMTQTPKKIQSLYTGSKSNPEQRIAYFGEDIGLNTHHVMWHLEFPFWWNDEIENHHLSRKGENFFWVHHQLTVRYDAERLSNWLEPVEELHWDDLIHEGFAPHTMYKHGGFFPSRPDNIAFEDVDGVANVRDMLILENRIRDAIAHGYVTGRDGSAINIRNEQGINVLGNVMESSTYSPNPEYYGALHNTAHMMLGRQGDPHGKFDLPPGVLEHFETATRDPAFFRLHKYMDNIFKEHKHSLPPYTKSDLEFPGVAVDSITIDGELETFFEDFEYSLLNAVDDTADIEDVEITTYVPRLDHKEFSLNVDVTNNNGATVDGTVRIFAWPRFDNNDVKFTIHDGFWNAIELDKFWVKLTPGANHIVRKSTDSALTVPDVPSLKYLMQKADAALTGGNLDLEKFVTAPGLPNRFLIPKGNEKGMEFVLVVFISDGKADAALEDLHTNTKYIHYGYCGTYPDNRPHGYPLDRHIDDERILNELHNYRQAIVKVYNHGEHIHHH